MKSNSTRHIAKNSSHTIGEGSKVINQNVSPQNYPEEINHYADNQPMFETKNQLFELKTRYHELEYQKAKAAISSENQIRQLKYKNGYLQNFATDLERRLQQANNERDGLFITLSEVREQNHQLSKQIADLKLEVEAIFTKKVEQVESPIYLYNSPMKDISIEKIQNEIVELREMSKIRTSNSIQIENEQRKNIDAKLEQKQKDLQEIKMQNNSLLKQINQKNSKIEQLFKDMEQLQQKYNLCVEQMNTLEHKLSSKLKLEQQEVKRLVEEIKQEQKLSHNKDQEIRQLSKQILEFQIEISKSNSQKSSLQQYIKYIEQNANDTENKRKILQEQCYQNQKQISNLQSQIFQIKLQHKKALNHMKLAIEEERINLNDQVDEREKEVFKLKELSLSTERKMTEMDEIFRKYEQVNEQFCKLKEKNGILKMQNDQLKTQISIMAESLEQINDKNNNRQKNHRLEWQKKIKFYQKEIQKLQDEKTQLLSKKQIQSKEPNKLNQKMDNQNNHSRQLNQMLDELKKEKKQFEQKYWDLKTKYLELEATKSNLQERVKSLSIEMESYQSKLKSNSNKQQMIENYKIIFELEIDLQRKEDQVKKYKSACQNIRRQHQYHLQSSLAEKRKLQQELKKTQQNLFLLTATKQLLETNLKNKQIQITAKCDEINRIKREQEKRESLLNSNLQNQVSIQNNLKSMQNQIQILKAKHENDLNQREKQIRKQIEKEIMLKIRQFETLKSYCQKLQSKLQLSQSNQQGNWRQKFLNLEIQNRYLKYDYSEALKQINILKEKIEFQATRNSPLEINQQLQLQKLNKKYQESIEVNINNQRMIKQYEIKIDKLKKELKVKQDTLKEFLQLEPDRQRQDNQEKHDFVYKKGESDKFSNHNVHQIVNELLYQKVHGSHNTHRRIQPTKYKI